MTGSESENVQARCAWCSNDELYQSYHDNIWGRPRWDSQDLFAKLCLDGQQAGLSWITILKKEHTYYEAYDDFNAEKIVHYDAIKVETLMQNPGIVRNKLKINSVIKNAKGYLEIEAKEGSFSEFIWSFVSGKTIQNSWQSKEDVPVSTPASEAMSKALKKRGFSFVGPTICYAFMQAVGMVNDHTVTCPQWNECR
jgi:DNA-3-methyladenine glycosylase I